jgi:ribosomal protein S18 acetylase RimI-like enzyme
MEDMRKPLYAVARRALYTFRAWREYFRPVGPLLFKHMRPADVVVARVGEKDIALLERCLPSKHASKHRDRLQAQKEGTAEYLVAWYGIPIGYILIVWDVNDAEPLRELAGLEEGTTYMEDLYVHPAARGKGIGKLLWDAGDARLRERGYRAVLGTVMLSNPEMEGTHLRRGYRPLDSKIYDYRTRYKNKNGCERVWSTRVRYFIRDL